MECADGIFAAREENPKTRQGGLATALPYSLSETKPLGRGTTSHDERNHKKHKEDDEKNLRDLRSQTGNSEEAEEGRYQCDD
jgi:hypothetical protein